MYILDLSEPIAIVISLFITTICIVLGKQLKKSFIPAIPLLIFAILILIHVFQSAITIDLVEKAITKKSLGTDAVMIFLSYISYLWVDDIEAKEKNKKSIDNSLDWFWKKI